MTECPKCSSPRVEYGSLSGARATCLSCGWVGLATELLSVVFSHEFSDKEDMIRRMVTDLRNVMAAGAAVPFARFLVKWGFLGQPVRPKELARYMKAAVAAMVTSVIEERGKIVDGNRPVRVRGFHGGDENDRR